MNRPADLPLSHSNIGNRLSDLGGREDALTEAREATDLYRGLAWAQPEAFTPNLAKSLNNLANILSALGGRVRPIAQGRSGPVCGLP